MLILLWEFFLGEIVHVSTAFFTVDCRLLLPSAHLILQLVTKCFKNCENKMRSFVVIKVAFLKRFYIFLVLGGFFSRIDGRRCHFGGSVFRGNSQSSAEWTVLCSSLQESSSSRYGPWWSHWNDWWYCKKHIDTGTVKQFVVWLAVEFKVLFWIHSRLFGWSRLLTNLQLPPVFLRYINVLHYVHKKDCHFIIDYNSVTLFVTNFTHFMSF